MTLENHDVEKNLRMRNFRNIQRPHKDKSCETTRNVLKAQKDNQIKHTLTERHVKN